MAFLSCGIDITMFLCVCVTIIKGLSVAISIAIFSHPKFTDNTCIVIYHVQKVNN